MRKRVGCSQADACVASGFIAGAPNAIESGDDDGPMVVSLQACSAFVGWQHEDFFLHEDDIAALSEWLGTQALKNAPNTVAAASSSLGLQAGSPSPA